MANQRTMLPYRLNVSLRVELILDEVRWREDNTEIEMLLELIVRRAPGWDLNVMKLQTVLTECLPRLHASILVDDLIDAVAAVWLFEREFLFERGFAPVPLSTINSQPSTAREVCRG